MKSYFEVNIMKFLEEYAKDLENFKQLSYNESYQLEEKLEKLKTAVEAARAINKWETNITEYYNSEDDEKHFLFRIDAGTVDEEHIISSKQEWEPMSEEELKALERCGKILR